MKIDEIDIITQELGSPIGRKYKYFAFVRYLYVEDKNEIYEVNNVDFKETYGVTKEEARDKMKQKVQQWINSQ